MQTSHVWRKGRDNNGCFLWCLWNQNFMQYVAAVVVLKHEGHLDASVIPNAENSKIWNRTGHRCASSPGLGVNLAIKHERVECSAGYADGTILAKKCKTTGKESIGKQGKLLISGWCCFIVLIFPFLWGCIWHTKEQVRCHKEHMHSSVAGENQQPEFYM